MSPIDDVTALLKTAGGQAQFIEWSRSPVTQMLLSAARHRALPSMGIGPSTASFTERSLAAHFYSRGANDIIDFFVTPVSVLSKDATQTALEGNYGALSVMETFGHGPRTSKERSAQCRKY